MKVSIKFDTVKTEWFTIHPKGSQVITSKNILFLSLKNIFVLANSANPDEKQTKAEFHLVCLFGLILHVPVNNFSINLLAILFVVFYRFLIWCSRSGIVLNCIDS